jgi:hypothetical protein
VVRRLPGPVRAPAWGGHRRAGCGRDRLRLRLRGHRWHHLGRCSQCRRVEQYRVFTQNAPGRPGQFQQQVQEWLVDRLRRGHVHHEAAVGTRLQIKAQLGQSRVEFEVGLPKSRLGGEPNLECGRLVLADRGHLHISAQRLPERRLHVQAAQTGSMRASGRETQS